MKELRPRTPVPHTGTSRYCQRENLVAKYSRFLVGRSASRIGLEIAHSQFFLYPFWLFVLRQCSAVRKMTRMSVLLKNHQKEITFLPSISSEFILCKNFISHKTDVAQLQRRGTNKTAIPTPISQLLEVFEA